MYECRFHTRKYPKEGEIIIGRVVTIDCEGVSINLLEYGDAVGLVLLGELSKKRIKSIQQITKIGNIEVCHVLRVDQNKGYIDLSMSKVTEAEKISARETFSKNKLAYQIMRKAASMLQKEVADLYEEFGYEKGEEFGSLYYFFARVKDNYDILPDNELGNTVKNLIKDQFQASTFKVRTDIEVTCYSSGGIQTIKKVFEDISRTWQNIEVCLTKTPIYSMVCTMKNKEEAFESVKGATKSLIERMKTEGGHAHVVCEPRLYGEKSKYGLLKFDGQEQPLSDEDDSGLECESQEE